MKPGDVCWVRAEGRTYLAIIERVGYKVHIKFTNGRLPVIGGHRRQQVALPKDNFTAHGKSGVDWLVGGIR